MAPSWPRPACRSPPRACSAGRRRRGRRRRRPARRPAAGARPRVELAPGQAAAHLVLAPEHHRVGRNRAGAAGSRRSSAARRGRTWRRACVAVDQHGARRGRPTRSSRTARAAPPTRRRAPRSRAATRPALLCGEAEGGDAGGGDALGGRGPQGLRVSRIHRVSSPSSYVDDWRWCCVAAGRIPAGAGSGCGLVEQRTHIVRDRRRLAGAHVHPHGLGRTFGVHTLITFHEELIPGHHAGTAGVAGIHLDHHGRRIIHRRKEGATGIERESMEFDVLIVGGGPCGPGAAIRLKQLAADQGRELSVCVIEKGSEIGAHILSGAVIDPRARRADPRLEGQGRAARTAGHRRPVPVPDRDNGVHRVPTPHCRQLREPRQLHRQPGQPGRWLGEQAEALGVEIYPASPPPRCCTTRRRVKGVATGDMGVLGKDGEPGRHFTARHGAARQVHAVRRRLPRPPGQAARGALRPARRRRPADLRPRHQGAVGGRPEMHQPGPGDAHRRLADGQRTPTAAASSTTSRTTSSRSASWSASATRTRYLSPFEEFQRFKTHPGDPRLLEGGKRLAYGARAINAGGLQSCRS
jgi:hypothetical protein